MTAPTRITLLVLLFVLLGIGCKPNSRSRSNQALRGDPQEIQSQTMAFANRYLTATATVFNQVKENAKTPRAQLLAVRAKILAADTAIGHAVELNPLVGLMNMAVMVTINRQIAEKPWVTEIFGRENAALIHSVLKLQEADIWKVAAQYLTPDQIAELHKLADQWVEGHPDERYAISVQLEDFPQAKQGAIPGQQLVSSVFNLVTLDPFAGLDPAVQEVEQSRILAERMFFYLRHMPAILAWQTEALYLQMLEAPQVKQVLTDTTTVAGSTTRFTDSTTKFADVSGQFADTIEKFRVQLPDQQATLVKQLNALIATQREAALKQATTQVSAEMTETVKQLNSTITNQQDLMTRNLKGVMDNSIDRLYQRARALVVIAAGSILAALLIYRLVATRVGPRSRA